MNVLTIYTAAGIIIQDKKLLVARPRGKEVFIAPGGTIEQNETPKQTLVRELKEEFCIIVKESDLEEFGVFESPATERKDKKVYMTAFIVKYWEGEPIPDNEVEELKWINSSAIGEIKLGYIFTNKVIPELKEQGLID